MASKTSVTPRQLRFELITLGDELLIGRTPNGHLTFLGDQLARRGVTLQRNITITDSATAIAAQFSESWQRSDVVITTGGLGPTCDDRTREVIAEALGQKLVFDETTEKAIAARFARLGRTMTPNNLKQAYRPERGECIANPNGTAPGLWIEHDGKLLIMLPGPPNELRPMFLDSIIPRLAAGSWIGERETFISLRTAGVGESNLETMLQPIFDQHPDLQVAFCAHQGAVDVRLSSESGATSLVEIKKIADACAARLGKSVFTFGDATLADVVCDQLAIAGAKLLVIEDLTAGELTRTLKASEFSTYCFEGAIIAEDAGLLRKLFPEVIPGNADCEQRARAIVRAAAERFKCDYTLCLLGDISPLETRFSIALHSSRNLHVKAYRSTARLETIRTRAVNEALDFFRHQLCFSE